VQSAIANTAEDATTAKLIFTHIVPDSAEAAWACCVYLKRCWPVTRDSSGCDRLGAAAWRASWPCASTGMLVGRLFPADARMVDFG
jgi:hypothetical protein